MPAELLTMSGTAASVIAALAGVLDGGGSPRPFHDLGLRLHRAPGVAGFTSAPNGARPRHSTIPHRSGDGLHSDRADLLALGETVCAHFNPPTPLTFWWLGKVKQA